MCGIIGYLGKSDGIGNVLDGLAKLEHRGCDSAGVAFINISNDKIDCVKAVGQVDQLIKKTADLNLPQSSRIAIGHTRWATHGGVTELNAHPHVSNNGEIAVVHNGIIENYLEIIELLKRQGIKIKSETDTEVIPNLVQIYYKGDLKDAVQKATEHVKGSFAIVVMSAKNPDTMVCTKRNMPLCVGSDKDFTYITSDIQMAMAKAAEIYILENDEIAMVNGKLEFYKSGKSIEKQPAPKTQAGELISKGEFSTFMEKEINDIPAVFEKIISHYNKKDALPDKLLTLLRKATTIHICACGTAYHAGLTLAALIEKHCRIRVRTHIASEFSYNDSLIFPNDVGIVISQSGETADTITAMNLMKDNNIPVVAFCNTDNSTISREADFYLPTLAGSEIAVASTKAYCAQVLLGAILVNKLCNCNFSNQDFSILPAHARACIAKGSEIAQLAAKYKNIARIFFIGKGMDACAAREAALKVKEVTYVQCEGYNAGELKHGTLSLVDDQTLTGVFQTNTDPNVKAKTENAANEVKARGSKIWNIDVPDSPLAFCYSVIPVHFFALHLSTLKGNNTDKPRNLAKAVTVE